MSYCVYTIRVSDKDGWPESIKAAQRLAECVPEILKAGKELRRMADPLQNMSDIPLKDAFSRWDKAISVAEVTHP